MRFNYEKLTGDIITKDSFNYEESRKAWNRAIEKYPLVIVYCKNNNDIINAIKWANSNSVEFRIRSGTHHYEGYSTGNDVMIIDVSKMNKIVVDEEKSIVTIEAGVRNRELYEALGSKGYAFPGGGCPTVGVVGFTLGGGWGYSARLLGLGADNLASLKLIDGEGNVVEACENKNSDLFWACRGAGSGNFGVISSMTFKLSSKIEMATLIGIEYYDMNYSDIVKVFNIYQEEFQELDRRINFKMAIYNSKEKGIGVKITGVFYGTREEANKIILPFKNIECSVNVSLRYMKVLEANRIIQDSHPEYENYKSGGKFVNKKYTEEEIKQLINLILNRAEGSIYTALTLYGLGGAVSDVNKNDTAFYYRNSKFIMGFQSVWESNKYSEINNYWFNEKMEVIKTLTVGAFINFPFNNIKEYEKEYYGDNYLRLREIKKMYDKTNKFKFPQSIKIE